MSDNSQSLVRARTRADPSVNFSPVVQLIRLYYDLVAFKIRTEYEAKITTVRETRVDKIVVFDQMNDRYDHCETEMEWLEAKEKELQLDLARLHGMNSLGAHLINAELENVWRQRQDFQDEITALKEVLSDMHKEKASMQKKLEEECEGTLQAMKRNLRMRLYGAI